MRNRYVVLLLVLVVSNGHADVPDAQKHEVEHLIRYVEQSGCLLERNGSKHSGKDAADHIQKKYDYYRDDITSTESFIEYSASKSALSGKAYKVYCPGKSVMETRQWLLVELAEYRKR